MKLSGIDHVALTCASVDVTREWFVRVLGFQHVFAGAWDGVPVFLKLESTCLALFPMRGTPQAAPQRPGFDHLAFNAATQAAFREAQESLKGHGIPFEFSDHGISRSIYFEDPDGRTLEITTYDVPGRL